MSILDKDQVLNVFFLVTKTVVKVVFVSKSDTNVWSDVVNACVCLNDLAVKVLKELSTTSESAY